jgi:hypothetical protein
MWTGFIGFIKAIISGIAELILASRDGLCSLELNESNILLTLISNKQACLVFPALLFVAPKNGDMEQSSGGLSPHSCAGTEDNKTTPVRLVCGSYNMRTVSTAISLQVWTITILGPNH